MKKKHGTRMVRDYVQVDGAASLDELIARLEAVRNALPNGAEAMVRLRGDDHFGRHIAIAYQRPLTEAEAGAEARNPLRPLLHVAA